MLKMDSATAVLHRSGRSVEKRFGNALHLEQPSLMIGSDQYQPAASVSSSSPTQRSTNSSSAAISSQKPIRPKFERERSSTMSLSPASSVSTIMAKDGTTPTQRISRAKKGKRVHACNYATCEKVFTRAEHLRRHQLNHSTEVYYKCDMCDKTFVRQDLLTRHTERHASQARKAVQTLAIAQRHRHFSSQFGINGITVLAAPPPPPTSGDYGGSTPVFSNDSHQNVQVHPPDTVLPHLLSAQSPTHPASGGAASLGSPDAATSMPGYRQHYPTPISMTQAGDSPLGFASADSSPSPVGARRTHLPFHLQHNEPQRQPEQYLLPLTSHPEPIRRPLSVPSDRQQHLYTSRLWENYDWLLDAMLPDQVVMEMNQNQVTFIHPLEVQHYRNMGNLSTNQGKATDHPVFHPIDEATASQIFLLVGNAPNVHAGNASIISMQRYLKLYWTEFHPWFPLLHRPTFLPSMQLVMMVAIVLAIGASFSEPEANPFAMAIYDRVKEWIFNSEGMSTHNPTMCVQQIMLLTDIFGKLRSTRAHLEGTQLGSLLLLNIRRSQVSSNDPLRNVRRYQQQRMNFDFQSEWQTWIDLESKKRLSFLFFFWEAQQATLFGQDMCQTVFDLRLHLPCEEYLWNAETPAEWYDGLDGLPESLGFLDTLKIFFDCRRQPPALAPFNAVLILYGLVAVGLDLQKSAPPSVDDMTSKQGKLSRAFEIWRGQYETLMPQVLTQQLYQRVVLIYHMAHIALHTNQRDVLAVAGDRRLSKSDPDDFYRAKQEVQQWVNLPSAQIAAWHAVQILLRYLSSPHDHRDDFYSCWSSYIAALICWAYGHLSPPNLGPGGVMEVEDEPYWDLQQEMRIYLQQMNTETWESLAHVRRHKRRTGGLLAVLGDSLKLARWGLLQDSLAILKGLGLARTVKGA